MSAQDQKTAGRVSGTGHKAWIASIGEKLIEPSDKIRDPNVRFRARIVTIITLILTATSAISVLVHSDLSPFILLLLIASYFISRTRYYIYAAFLVIGNISFFVILALFDEPVLSREIVFMTVAWLTPSLILAGLIFSIPQMLLVSVFHILVPFGLLLIIPDLTLRAITVGNGYLLVISALIVVSMYLRNLIEAQNQRQLAELNQALEDRVKERTAQLEAFAYSVSHDLRAPLRALRGFSEILSSEFSEALDPEAALYVDRISSSSQKMDQLIDGMLLLSRLGRAELNFENLNLSAMVSKIFSDLVENEASPDQFELIVQECLPVNADRQLTSILLTNLLSNAIKFSRGRKPTRIEFGCLLDDDGSQFYVQDNGIGFDPSLTERVLQPFQRLHPDEEFEGSGIGLAIAQRIIQRHDGTLWIESQPDKGTTVYFSL